MSAKLKKLIFLLVLCLIFFPKAVLAQETNCANRYVTFVNPVRGRQLWLDKDISHLNNQYKVLDKNNFPATWLLQYNAFQDPELLKEFSYFNKDQEFGVLLEVSDSLAKNSRVIYPFEVPWFNPKAVFLSAYSQSERKRMIDTLFSSFKEKFSVYPKSVGAWWIDSYSLEYMRSRYGIKTALIVADQKTTDSYGVWGQWWGVPYYPTKANILTPAQSLSDKEDVAIIQWAQRDPLLSYGSGPKYSNYSLQANDYIRQGLDTSYFDRLSSIYLDCKNPIGQITVGLESGIESIGYQKEYENQLNLIKEKSYITPVTMSKFYARFSQIYPTIINNTQIGEGENSWILDTQKRMNTKLGDKVSYTPQISFKDYFISDKNNFLSRDLTTLNVKKDYFIPWFVLLFIISLPIYLKKKKGDFWFASTLVSLGAFGLIFRSFTQFGWKVYFGFINPQVEILQIIAVILAFFYTYLYITILKRISKLKQWMIYLFPLVFGFDYLITYFRMSLISGYRYIGFSLDELRFLGIAIGNPLSLKFINIDLPAYQAQALLRFDFSKIWNSPLLSLVVYPLTHLLLAVLIVKLLTLANQKTQKAILFILTTLFILEVCSIFSLDPRVVLP